MLTGKIAPMLLVLAFAVLPAMADADPAAEKAAATIEKGLIYLKTQQKPDDSWERAGDPPAVSALVLKAFMQNSKYDADQPFLEKGFTKLLSYQKEDGGIYRDLLANYNTAIAISALAVSKEAEYQPQMQKAVVFLKRLQWTDKAETVAERQQVAATDPRFGGFGYGKRERPDGSNLQIAMDALHDACVLPSDPAYAAAVTFESRLQNNKATNDQAWAGTDGGFIYTDADGGNSPAGEYTTADGKPMFRSYGSMTYAGLKTMVYAGLSKDDPRVKAAMGWIQSNWTWDENPGIKLGDGNVSESGLFYYYHTASRTLHAYGQPVVTDAAGKQHDWRHELIDKLASIQKPDGSWVGQSKWMENNPTLATAFAVLSLEEAQQDLTEHASK